MLKKILFLIILFLLVRVYAISAYKDYYYLYVDFASQFSIASAMYKGHPFSVDSTNTLAVAAEANKENKYIPLEKWKDYPVSGKYEIFPAVDLPGFGYLIAYTSKFFGGELTSKYAFAIQILMELLSLLGFLYCIYLIWGERLSFIAGLIYIFAYPFIWPLATQPARDMFTLGSFSALLVSFCLFYFKSNWRWWFVIIGLLAIAAILLWVRPTNYYYFFFISPLILFLKKRSIKERLAFFLSMITIPIVIFDIPFKSFNLKYYGVTDTYVVGRGLWEGLGIVEKNPYGFVLNDSALVPFIERYYHKKVQYASVEMNQLLSEYAFAVIKKDSLFYLQAINARVKKILAVPLEVYVPDWHSAPKPLFAPMYAYLTFLQQHHYEKMFFELSLILAAILFLISNNKKLFVLVLLSPLFYTLAWELALNADPRSTATAAWVLILPLAYCVNFLSILLAQCFWSSKRELGDT